MSYRLCGRNEAQNSRSDPYADGTRKKSSVHKCQNLAILDRTLLSIRQGPPAGFAGQTCANIENADAFSNRSCKRSSLLV